MPAPRGGRKPGDRKPGRPVKKDPGRSRRLTGPRALPVVTDTGLGLEVPRPPRPAPEYRVESAAGLRHEIVDLRAEVHRLAAEIDKLWARERGRAAATPGRTPRSIAGKPVRTGTRSARPAGPSTTGRGRPGATRSGSPGRRPSAGSRASGGPKRAAGAKRGAGWAKPKTKSRRSGTTPRRQGR